MRWRAAPGNSRRFPGQLQVGQPRVGRSRCADNHPGACCAAHDRARARDVRHPRDVHVFLGSLPGEHHAASELYLAFAVVAGNDYLKIVGIAEAGATNVVFAFLQGAKKASDLKDIARLHKCLARQQPNATTDAAQAEKELAAKRHEILSSHIADMADEARHRVANTVKKLKRMSSDRSCARLRAPCRPLPCTTSVYKSSSTGVPSRS